MDCILNHTPATCGFGCDRLGYCYARAIMYCSLNHTPADCSLNHTPATCGFGCDRLGYCYARAIDALCERIRAVGEARRLIALLDLADQAEREE
jgi:hypothetical protein